MVKFKKGREGKVKDKRKMVWLILVLAFFVRISYLFFLKDTVFYDPYIMDKHDQKTFILWAEQILKHPFYVDGNVFYMAPFYPYFLALLYFITGGNLFGIYIIQILFDVFLCYLIYLLGKMLVDEWVGVLSCFFYAFYKTFVVYSISILSDSIISFLYFAFVTCLYIALKKTNLKWWTITGILLGFSALAKPTISIFLPFLLIGLILYPEKNIIPLKISTFKQKFLVFFILVFISGLTILPVTIRNWYVGKVFIPICSNGPINWRIGNSADSIGLFYYPKGPLLSPFSIAFWRLFIKKMNLFFVSYEWPQNMNVYLMDRLIPSLKFAFIRFGFLVPTGLFGLILFFKDFKKNFLFISFTLSNVLWVVLFFITDRYRLPAVCCFSISSSYLILWCLKEIFRNKRILRPFILILLTSIFAYMFNYAPNELLPEESKKIFGYLSSKGITKDLEAKEINKAFKKAKDFLRILPDDPKSNFLMAVVYYEMEYKDTAILYLQKALEINPEFKLAEEFLKDIINKK
ncbi:MAG: glycosyltransferase family 39 protein [Candidatus Omnitrophica bacterium]|nr:glycosyltransferase family 39 protein [Candidatus Omnitrophota bacterium]MCM8802013.1 glycosyltransferase family 39 protein [Candidatus Omnitrophota bacterium]